VVLSILMFRFWPICANCENLKQSKGKAYNTTLSDDFDNDETPDKD
jgi:hypothetical protein